MLLCLHVNRYCRHEREGSLTLTFLNYLLLRVALIGSQIIKNNSKSGDCGQKEETFILMPLEHIFLYLWQKAFCFHFVLAPSVWLSSSEWQTPREPVWLCCQALSRLLQGTGRCPMVLGTSTNGKQMWRCKSSSTCVSLIRTVLGCHHLGFQFPYELTSNHFCNCLPCIFSSSSPAWSQFLALHRYFLNNQIHSP